MEKQILAVARSAFYQLRQIGHLWAYVHKKSLITIVFALLISKMDSLHRITLEGGTEAITAPKCSGQADPGDFKIRSYISMVLAHVPWLPVCFCAKFKVLVQTDQNPYWFGTSLHLRVLVIYHSHLPHLSSFDAVREFWKSMARDQAFSVGVDSLPMHQAPSFPIC